MTQNTTNEEIFVLEGAVIDIACKKTVGSKQWFVYHKSNLTEIAIKNIKNFPLKTFHKHFSN